MKKILKNIIFFSVLILICLYLVETYLTVQNRLHVKQLKQNKASIYKKNTGKDYDMRSYYEIYEDLKEEDPNVTLRIKPSRFINDKNLDYLPLSGLANRKTILCNESGYYVIYQSDRHGFNNPDTEWNKKEIEFLLIGDSSVHGYCVDEPYTIGGVLRKLNKNKNGIINLGQSGNDPLIEYATLKEYLPLKKVKRVLWFYYNRDLEDLVHELDNKILANYLDDKNFNQNIILKKKHTERLLLKKLEQQLAMHHESNKSKIIGLKLEGRIFPKLIRFTKLSKIRAKLLNVGNNDLNFLPVKEFTKILKFSNEFAQKNNSKLYFVYLPHYYRYTGYNNNDYSFNYKTVINIVDNLNIPIIDLN